MAMVEDECWGLIEAARAAAAGDPDRHAALIAERLAARPAADIVSFGHWFRTKMDEANRTDLVTAVEWIYAANGLPHVSGDGWEYFRGWLVARGRRDFDAALADADVLADLFTTFDDFLSGEEVEYAAHDAYERATGARDVPEAMNEPSALESWPADVGSNARDPERFMARFPKLAARFGRQQFWDEAS
ncbi:MAG TPA: DUF4240 domain-containing protein [Humisphaera sp.]